MENFPHGKPNLRDLLEHKSGLPPWYPIKLLSQKKEEAILKIPILQKEAPNIRTEYSCLGYILLGFWLEENFNKGLDILVEENILKPLNLEKEIFFPFKNQVHKFKVAGSEFGNKIEDEKGGGKIEKRESPIWGEVHDGNAHFLGGFAGNAGLFGTIKGVFELFKSCSMYSFEGKEGEYFNGFKIGGEKTEFPKGTLGHTGFTGTSVCFHLKKNLISILLTNRLHQKSPPDLFIYRKNFHKFIENLV